MSNQPTALLSALTPELILMMYDELDYAIDVNSFFRVCRRFYAMLNLRLNRFLLNHIPCPALERAVETGDAQYVQFLLGSGVAPDTLYNGGWTPIYLAAQNGQVEVVKVFLDHGVNLDPAKGFWRAHETSELKSPRGNLLFVAIENGHEDLVRFLLENGAQSTIPDDYSFAKQPLALAFTLNQLPVVQLRLENGPDPNAPYIPWDEISTEGPSIEGDGADLNFPKWASIHSPITDAFLRGNISLVDYLLDILSEEYLAWVSPTDICFYFGAIAKERPGVILSRPTCTAMRFIKPMHGWGPVPQTPTPEDRDSELRSFLGECADVESLEDVQTGILASLLAFARRSCNTGACHRGVLAADVLCCRLADPYFTEVNEERSYIK